MKNNLLEKMISNLEKNAKESAIETAYALKDHLAKLGERPPTIAEHELMISSHVRGFILGAEWFGKCYLEAKSGTPEQPS